MGIASVTERAHAVRVNEAAQHGLVKQFGTSVALGYTRFDWPYASPRLRFRPHVDCPTYLIAPNAQSAEFFVSPEGSRHAVG